MDFIDKQILLSLLANCRVTYQELANVHNMSSNAIKKRIDKMESNGIIESYVIELSFAMVDAESAMFFVSTNGKENNSEFINDLGKHETINYVGELSGSVYIVFSSYQNGSLGLGQVASFLRSFEFVINVESFPLYMTPGQKKDFSHQELLIIRELVKNPREPVSSIANATNLPARLIKKTIDDLTKGYVSLTIRWNLNAGNNITFLERIEFDEKITSLNSLNLWLGEQFKRSYLTPIICTTVPVLYAVFVVDQLAELQEIEPIIKKYKGIKSLTTFIGKPSVSFDDIKSNFLKKLIAKM